MYKVYYSNLWYFDSREFETFNAALDHAKSAGFEATIHREGLIVASWSPIGGLRKFSE